MHSSIILDPFWLLHDSIFFFASQNGNAKVEWDPSGYGVFKVTVASSLLPSIYLNVVCP